MGDNQQVEFRNPNAVLPRDETPKGFCQVTVKIPELRTRRGFSKKKLVTKPSVGKCKPEFKNRSVSFTVDCMTEQKKLLRYKLEVKKLPADIIPDQCYTQFEEKKVILYLKKAVAQSWEAELSNYGIDLCKDDDEEEDSDSATHAKKSMPAIEQGQGDIPDTMVTATAAVDAD